MGGGNADGGPDPLDEVDGLLLRSVQMCKDLTGLWSPLVLYESGLVAALRWLGGDREAGGPFAHGAGDPADSLTPGAGGASDFSDGDDADGPGAGFGPIPAGLTVHVDCEDGAEPDTQDGRLLLYQAAVELLANVTRHAGVNEAVLTLHRRPPGGGPGGDEPGEPALLELCVSDAGRGFEVGGDPTAPAPVSAQRFGLFALRERLALAGGALEIDTVAGEGSRVTALCPQATGRDARRPAFADPEPDMTDRRPGAAPDRGADPIPGAAAPGAGAGPLRVVIADDNRIIQLSVGSLLTSAPDIEVVGRAADGFEAVTLALELDPDVILMDISMPGLNGVEATRRVKAAAPHVRVIGLSMHETDDRERDMFEAGAERYVVKDGPPETLLHAIRTPPAPTA